MKKIKLEDIEKKVPFDVPDGYFEMLTKDIQDKVASPKRNWAQIPQVRWAMAGSLSLVLALLIIFYPTTSSPTVDDLLSDISEQDLVAYLDFVACNCCM